MTTEKTILNILRNDAYLRRLIKDNNGFEGRSEKHSNAYADKFALDEIRKTVLNEIGQDDFITDKCYEKVKTQYENNRNG